MKTPIDKTKQVPSAEAMRQAGLCSKDLLAAEDTLAKVSILMNDHYRAVGGHDWPREWMQEHVNRRGAIIKARDHLIDMAEAANDQDQVPQVPEIPEGSLGEH